MTRSRAKTHRKTVLRPMDIAWQAYQAGAALSTDGYAIEHLNMRFKAWWKRHPQALTNGELKEET